MRTLNFQLLAGQGRRWAEEVSLCLLRNLGGHGFLAPQALRSRAAEPAALGFVRVLTLAHHLRKVWT